MIDDCERRSGQLSDWELSFLASLRERIDGHGTGLTARQHEKLNQIWDRVTKNQPGASRA